ncbi:MAG: glycosyltransferase family 4 protein [Kiritimatiellia bacterium]|jgi:glycosyltransferase involved in cell wall biosynthesis
MKILLDARTDILRFPGVARYAAELSGALANLFASTGDQLTVICNSAVRETIPESANIEIFGCDVPPDVSDSYGALDQILHAVHPDLYHTPNRICKPLETLPTVLTLHDCVPVKCAFETSPQERIAYLTSVGSALKTCTRSIVVTQATLDDIRELFPGDADKCRVIPHGVGAHFKPTSAAGHAEAEKALGYRRPMILYIGNTKRHKNLVALFRGYDRARKMLHGVRLVLGGYGCKPVARHKRAIEELGLEDLVAWIGEIPEALLPAVLSSATAFAMPSIYEGFCMSVVEAMACGAPVACSDIPAFREICGDTATYFDTKDPDSIAQALVTVVTDNIARNRNRAAAFEKVKRYTWDAAARATLDVYHEALAAWRASPPRSGE